MWIELLLYRFDLEEYWIGICVPWVPISIFSSTNSYWSWINLGVRSTLDCTFLFHWLQYLDGDKMPLLNIRSLFRSSLLGSREKASNPSLDIPLWPVIYLWCLESCIGSVDWVVSLYVLLAIWPFVLCSFVHGWPPVDAFPIHLLLIKKWFFWHAPEQWDMNFI